MSLLSGDELNRLLTELGETLAARGPGERRLAHDAVKGFSLERTLPPPSCSTIPDCAYEWPHRGICSQ